MTRPFSLAYKQKMVERLTGKNAVSATALARETGVGQQTLSRWLEEARTLPTVAKGERKKAWSVAEKVRLLGEAGKLAGAELAAFLQREGATLAELEEWRLALDEGGRVSGGTAKRIRQLERELARKEKALAEVAALLVLKKKVESLFPEDEDDGTDEGNEK